MKKPKKAWKPKSAAAQIAAHKKSVEATRKRDAHPAEAKAKAVKAARATLAAARKESVKVRKWSPDGDVALCSARAVAESLRIKEETDDMMKVVAMFDRGGDASELSNILELVTDAWNYFPHKILKGLSPAEKILEYQNKQGKNK